MKFISFLVVLSCFVASGTTQSVFEDIFKVFIERTRARFECGFKQLNLPSLDPLYIPAYELFLDNIGIAQNVNVSVTNVEGRGLSQFKINSISASIFTGKMSIDISYPEITIQGQQTSKGTTNGAPFSGTGPFTIAASNIRSVTSVDFQWLPLLKVNSLNSAISVETVAAAFTGFGNSKIDQQVSSVLSSGAPAWIAQNQDYISEQVRNVVMGYISELFKQTSSFDQLIFALITYNPANGC